MTRITEYVGRSGVVTSDWNHRRAATPRPGDPVRLPDGSIGRIDQVGTGFCKPDQVHICERTQSVFLMAGGAVSIGGGPFRMVARDQIEHTYELHWASFWNWGDRGAGANHGCDYKLLRPLFTLREAPDGP